MAKRTDELLSAVRHGTPELVRALALTGADIDECGNEALKEAINAERPEMLEMLISLGADITENRPAVAPEKRKAADYLTLNLLETYVLHKIATADSDTLSPKALSVASVLLKNGLALRDNMELILMAPMILVTPEILEKHVKMLEQVRSIGSRIDSLNREDSANEGSCIPDYDI